MKKMVEIYGTVQTENKEAIVVDFGFTLAVIGKFQMKYWPIPSMYGKIVMEEERAMEIGVT